MRSIIGLVLVAFACGVAWLQTWAALPAHPAWLTGAGVMALGFVAVARNNARPAWRTLLVVAAALLAGCGYAAWRAQVRMAEELPREWESVDVEIVGVVSDLPANSPQGTRFAFTVERVRTPRAVVPAQLSLAWFAPLRPATTGDVVPVVHAGERWYLTVRLKRPHGTVNPGAFDLEAWLLQQGFRATGYVHPDGLNARRDLFAARPGDYVQRARERIRDRIVAALAGAPYAGVIAALAIGDQRAIPEAHWTVFNRTGVSHLISISGLHVTVFAAFAGGIAFALARRSLRLTMRIPARKVAAVIGVVAAGCYVLLAGAAVPAVRTLAMLVVAACGLWLGRPGTAGVVWLWALAAVLLWDPWATLTPGFWLSFSAVGLLLYASTGRLRHAAPTGWPARLRDTVREGAHAQWVVTLGLAPLTLALFQQASLIAPIANAVAIPVVTLGVVPLALLGIVVPGSTLFDGAHALLALLMRFLESLAALPDATWEQHAPLPWTVAAGIAGSLWLLAPRGLPGRVWGLVWLLPLLVVRPEPPPHGAFRLTVLDVGQASPWSLKRTAVHWSTTQGRASANPPMRVAGSLRRFFAPPDWGARTVSSFPTRISTIPAERCHSCRRRQSAGSRLHCPRIMPSSCAPRRGPNRNTRSWRASPDSAGTGTASTSPCCIRRALNTTIRRRRPTTGRAWCASTPCTAARCSPATSRRGRRHGCCAPPAQRCVPTCWLFRTMVRARRPHRHSYRRWRPGLPCSRAVIKTGSAIRGRTSSPATRRRRCA